MSHRLLLPVCIMLVLISGCAAAPKMSPMQFRQISTRLIDGSYDNVFRATMTVLQDNSYIVKQTDMNTGLITAEINRETSGASQFMQSLFSHEVTDKGTLVEASCVIAKISDTSTEVRITVQEKTYSERGGTSGVKQLSDPVIYKKLFDDITIEVKRREAIGR